MTTRSHADLLQVDVLARRPDRRQGFRIDPDFQTRFRTVLLASSVLTLVVVAGLGMGVHWAASHPDSLPTSPWVPFVLFGVAPLVVLGLFHLSDRISHRYCGPIRRISDTLEAVRRGERTRPIQLRQKDEFHELAESVNAALRSLGALEDPPA